MIGAIVPSGANAMKQALTCPVSLFPSSASSAVNVAFFQPEWPGHGATTSATVGFEGQAGRVAGRGSNGPGRARGPVGIPRFAVRDVRDCKDLYLKVRSKKK